MPQRFLFCFPLLEILVLHNKAGAFVLCCPHFSDFPSYPVHCLGVAGSVILICFRLMPNCSGVSESILVFVFLLTENTLFAFSHPLKVILCLWLFCFDCDKSPGTILALMLEQMKNECVRMVKGRRSRYFLIVSVLPLLFFFFNLFVFLNLWFLVTLNDLIFIHTPGLRSLWLRCCSLCSSFIFL